MINLDSCELVVEAKKTKLIRLNRQTIAKLVLLVAGSALLYFIWGLYAIKRVLGLSLGEASGYTIKQLFLMLNMETSGFLLNLFSTIIYIVVAILFCRFIEKRSLHSMGFVSRNIGRSYFLGYVIGAVMLTACVLIAVLFGAFHIENAKDISLTVLTLFMVAYMIQGLAEEVVVHGLFMLSMMNRMKPVYALLVSSLLFSSLHIMNSEISLLAICNLFLFGLFEGLLMLRMDCIWGGAAAHSAWNFFQGNVFGLSVSGSVLTPSFFTLSINEQMPFINGNLFGIEASVITSACYSVGILILLFFPANHEKAIAAN